jgi:hypothetical protein
LKNDVLRFLLFTRLKIVLLLLLLLLLELEEVEGGCGNGRVNPEINCDFMAIFKGVSILLLW